MDGNEMVMANPQTPTRGRRGKTSDPGPSATDPQHGLSELSETSAIGTKRGWLASLAPALASAALLWSCYFPLAQGWLAWVALVPFLSLVRSPARPRHIYLSAFAGGLAFFWPVLQWLRVGDYNMMYYSWGALATYCAAYLPLTIFLARPIDRHTRLPLVLTFPAVWTSLEFLRAHFLTGFPWYFLAHSQHDYLAIIQVSDVSGAYGVSFLIAAVNVIIFEWLYARTWFRAFLLLPELNSPLRGWALPTQTAGAVLALGGVLAYGSWRLQQNSFDTGPRLALIQGNLDQDIRNDASLSERSAEDAFHHFRRLCDLAAAGQPTPDLIVWPENSYPGYWKEQSDGWPDEESQKFVRRAAQIWKTNLLFGLEAYVPGPNNKEFRYNSALLVLALREPAGVRGEPAGRYDKIHRVPFGEYVPFQEALPWMKTFAPYDFDYSIRSGKLFTHFPLDSYRFGVLICFEDTDPALAREYMGGRRELDFFINISNDGWWRGTSGHDEHLAISRFRAIENRRAVCRSVNMGISAVIDGNGHVLEPGTIQTIDNVKIWEIAADQNPAAELPVSRWSEFKQVQGVLFASVPIDHRSGLYARWGDWLPWVCWLAVAIGFTWSLLGRWLASRFRNELS